MTPVKFKALGICACRSLTPDSVYRWTVVKMGESMAVDVPQLPQLPVVDPRLLSSGRLTRALTAFLVLLLLALSSLMFGLVSSIFSRLTPSIRQDLEWKTVRGAYELARQVDLGLALQDEGMILKALGDFRSASDVLAIVVTDPAGKTLAKHGTTPESIPELFSGPPATLRTSDSGALVAWAPSLIESKEVGRVALVVSTARLQEGRQLRARILFVALGGCFLALLLSLFFVSFYVQPLIRLTQRTLSDLRTLNETLEQRVEQRTLDLARTNHKLTESLEAQQDMQRQLVDASRQAGMAEVATTVLHNVGNSLNSVNVSANVVNEAVAASKSVGLANVARVFEEHAADLGDYLVKDERGRKIPAYIAELVLVMEKERRLILEELSCLQRNIDHIKVIVSMQQDNAKVVGGVAETVSVAELMDDAIKFNSLSNERHGFVVTRELQGIPSIVIDRHKLLQVLINLLSNARHAIQESPIKKIVLRSRATDDQVAIEVEDSGCGIAPENRAKIFNHGFTTKKNGHGFGLHSSANAAAQLGGRLLVRSDGIGKGACFTIVLPLNRSSVPPLQ